MDTLGKPGFTGRHSEIECNQSRSIKQHIGATMRKSVTGVMGILFCGLIAIPAAAQTMKPGLWEITSKLGGDMGAQMAAAQAEMQQQLASMPPEQRKQMEQMLAQQGMGMGAGAGPGGGTAVRICLTKEMAARNEPPAQQNGDCKQEYSKRSGNTTRFKFVCTKPPSRGEGEVTLHSAESYSMKMTTMSQVKGQTEQMSMDARGKWLSNNCGNIKPAKG